MSAAQGPVEVTSHLSTLARDLDAVVYYRDALRSEAAVALDGAARLQADGLSAVHLIGRVDSLLTRIGDADRALAGLLEDVANALGEEPARG